VYRPRAFDTHSERGLIINRNLHTTTLLLNERLALWRGTKPVASKRNDSIFFSKKKTPIPKPLSEVRARSAYYILTLSTRAFENDDLDQRLADLERLEKMSPPVAKPAGSSRAPQTIDRGGSARN